jgi:hypothetical protein
MWQIHVDDDDKTSCFTPCVHMRGNKYRMAGNFQGVLIFVESRRKPSELIFVVLNFVTATQSIRAQRGANDDVINTCCRSRSISSVTEPLLQRNLDK